MSKSRDYRPSLKLTASLAMLVAISIILGKYLALSIGEVLRFSFENLPIIFAGIAFGPLPAALVAVTADLIGCLLVGYAVNPLVTIGAAIIGLCSGIVPALLKKIAGIKKDIITVGHGNRLEIWAADRYQDYMQNVDYDAALKRLGL